MLMGVALALEIALVACGWFDLGGLRVASAGLVCLLVFALLHGARRYGVAGIFALYGLTVVVTFALENASIATGFPFGHFHHVDQLHLGALGAVPLYVGGAYFANGYLAWAIANALLGHADERLARVADRFALPVIATFCMVLWDLVLDPVHSTLGGAWVWEQGGGYNGVPLSNFLGWFLTMALVYGAFTTVVACWTPPRAVAGRAYWLAPVLAYQAGALTYVFGYVRHAADARVVVDLAGNSWRANNVHETAAIVALCGMSFVVCLALARLYAPDRP